MFKHMQPPETGTPTSRVIFWFLAWHQTEFKKPFEFFTQKELAEAAGISEDAMSRIFKNPPAWFLSDGRKARIKDLEKHK